MFEQKPSFGTKWKWRRIIKDCKPHKVGRNYYRPKEKWKYLLEGETNTILPEELKQQKIQRDLQKDRKQALDRTKQSHNYNKRRFDKNRKEYKFKLIFNWMFTFCSINMMCCVGKWATALFESNNKNQNTSANIRSIVCTYMHASKTNPQTLKTRVHTYKTGDAGEARPWEVRLPSSLLGSPPLPTPTEWVSERASGCMRVCISLREAALPKIIRAGPGLSLTYKSKPLA